MSTSTGITVHFAVTDFVWVFKECHRAAAEHGLSWAVAGRSEGKLLAVLDRAGKAVAADLSTIPVIVSDFHQ